MSNPQYPSVEFVQREPESNARQSLRGRRWKVFLAVLVLTSAAGAVAVYSRPPLYRATVSVLTVKPKAVDLPSSEADAQHVAIQERLLLGEDLLAQLAGTLSARGDERVADRDTLRAMLGVEAVPDTNLLELRSEGDDPALLQRVVNAWAETYETFRREENNSASQRTTAELSTEARELQEKVVAARAELAAFREANDIVSLERDENRKLSGLKGLNASLNKARERLVEALARQTAVEEAIARGETVVPSEQKGEIARMRVSLKRASAKLAALRERYTDVYIERDPATRDLPEAVEEERQALETALQVARETVRDEARQAVSSARASVEALEAQLDAQQARVQQFTEKFKEFKTLEERLASLEGLAAEREQRLTQIDVQNNRRFPPMQVVDWARLPERPVSPDYEQDLLYALAAALALALFVTWIIEYLGGPAPGNGAGPVMGMRVAYGNAAGAIEAPAQDRLTPPARGVLPHEEPSGEERAVPAAIVPRELAIAEVTGLLRAQDPTGRALATLVLCGIAPHELPLLSPGCFDREARRVRVPGPSERSVSLDAASWSRVEPLLAEGAGAMAALLPRLEIDLAAAARAAGLADPARVTAAALWHTYVAYLARLGMEDEALRQRVGAVPDELLRAVAPLRPAHDGAASAGADPVYPALVEDPNARE